MFASEKIMVDTFIEYLETKDNIWGSVSFNTEFNYQRGKTDLVAISKSGKVLAFEAKLKKWKIALQQAYRNKCFADLSFVLLPESYISTAQKNKDEFDRRGVGLCYITKNNNVNIVFNAKPSEPLQPILRDKAFLYANFDEEAIDNTNEVRECC